MDTSHSVPNRKSYDLQKSILAAIFLAGLSSFSFAETLPQIAVGQAGSYLIKSDGTLWAWGDYNAGKTYGTPAAEKMNTHTVPAEMDGLSGVVAISVGGGHSMALKKDGTVWVWGNNEDGLLGSGAMAERHFPTPVRVSSLSEIKAIAAGDHHCLALKDDGTIWAWGNNSDGQLGDGTQRAKSASEIQVVNGLSDVTAVAAGLGHSLALKNDGTVWAWGYNDDGELGDGTRKGHLTATQIPGLLGVKAIAAGRHHSVALKNDGTVWVWGGDKETGQSATPRRLQGLSRIVAISAGGWNSLALKQDGTVWAWGAIANGEDDDTMNEVIKKNRFRSMASPTSFVSQQGCGIPSPSKRTERSGRGGETILVHSATERRPVAVCRYAPRSTTESLFTKADSNREGRMAVKGSDGGGAHDGYAGLGS